MTPAIDMNSLKINVYVFNRNTEKGLDGGVGMGGAAQGSLRASTLVSTDTE